MIDVLKLANVVAKLLNPQYGRDSSALLQRELVREALDKELRRQLMETRDDLEAAVDAAMVEMANISPPLRRSECKRLILAARAAGPQSGAWVLAEDVADMAQQLDVAMNGEEGAKRRAQLCDVVPQAVGILSAVSKRPRRHCHVIIEQAWLESDGVPHVERIAISAMPDWLQMLYRR